jgi:diacylglycerol kinase family enzyme
LLDLWLFSGNNFVDALRHAYNMWRGYHIKAKDALRIPFRHLRVEGESQFMVHTDAEPRGSAQQAEIRVSTRALKMLMPPRGMELLQHK